MAADETAGVKRVKVVSDEPMPIVPPAAVTVHYVEAGQRKTLVDHMKCPTYFDRLVVATVHDVAPGVRSEPVRVDSPRNLARFVYRAAGRAARSLRPRRVLAGPTLDTRFQEPNNVAHLLIDLIPYCLYTRAVFGAGAELTFLFRKLEKRYAALLEVFGIAPRFEAGEVEADLVKVRGARGLAVYDLLGTFDCTGINFLPHVYDTFAFPSSIKIDKVFLARRGARSLGNQAEIEALVKKHGYETVFMEDHSMAEQLSIGAHAKHVVSVHGAAMSFLAGSRHIDSLVELLPPHVYHAGFPVSLSPRVARYEQIIPDFDPAVVHSGWDVISRFKSLPFSVDARLLDDVLSQLP
jgi:Glycosyltransferase 61